MTSSLHSKLIQTQPISFYIHIILIYSAFTSFSSHSPIYSSHSTETPLKTASHKWLQNGLNEAEMREMEEILGPESKLEGLKMRLPIGQESKIKAYDWWRADDFKNSSHRPFVQKSLSFNLFWHHSGVFGVIPGTKSHFAVIGSIMEWLRYDSFTSFWNHGNEAQIGEWGNKRNYCKLTLLLRNDSKMAWMRLKWEECKRF